jgi:hypothetical protein
LIRQCWPVDHYCQWIRRCVTAHPVNQEARPVPGDIVQVGRGTEELRIQRKETHRATGYKASVPPIHDDSHQTAAACHIKQLPTIIAPSWPGTAAVGNLPAPVTARKRHNVDLVAAGFIRDISDPMTVRSKASVVRAKARGLYKREWFPITGYRQHPEICLGVGILAVSI